MSAAVLRVLLIEDNPADAILLRAQLERDTFVQFGITFAERLGEGLQTLAQTPFDVLLLDLGLPDGQGWETFQRAQAAAGNLPIVVLSGLMDEEIALRAVQSGAQDYVVKGPVGWDAVTRIIRYAIERHKLMLSIKEKEDRFSAAFDRSPVCQFITTRNKGRILAVNVAFCRMMGYQPEEVIGRTTLEINIWADIEERRAAFASFRQAGSIRDREVVFRTSSGELLNILASVEPIEIDGEECVISTALDITERKRAEALVFAQRDLARSVGAFPSISEGFQVILDTLLNLTGLDAGGIYLFDPGFQRLELIHHRGLSAEFVRAVSYFPTDSVNVQMILPGQPHYFASSDPGMQVPLRQLEKLLSLAVVPVLHQGHVIGCLNLASRSQAEIPTFSRQILETLAVEIGNVVRHFQSQAALHASEEKYRSLVEASDAIILMLDAQGRIQYMNEIAAKASDIDFAEAFGRTLSELLPAAIVAPYLERVQQVIASGQGVVIESQTTDGRYFRSSIQPVHDENGAAVMATISATDITDLKTAQKELLELNLSLEERIRQRTAEVQDLYDNAPTGYHSLNEGGRFVQINQTELNWLGYTRDELLGRPVTDILTTASIAAFQRDFPEFKQTGSLHDLELEFIRKDGSTFPVLVNAVAIFSEQRNFVMSRSTVFDNTARKAMEQTLRDSEEQNRLLFENTPDAVILFDQEVRFVRVNHAFELLSGFAVEQCIGSSFSTLGLLAEQQVASLESEVVAALQHQSGFASSEFRITSANGSQRDVGARVFAVTLQGRQHYLASMRDITVEKQAKEALRLANVEMGRALRMKDEFLANMSHELRTPLHGILAMSESLLDQVRGPLNERQQKSIRSIEDSGRHLLALINDLLDISKIEAGKLELHFEPVSVNDICQASLLFVREVALKKKIQVEYDNPLSGEQLLADAKRLKQMLVNLLSNAVKFTPEGGRVALRVSVDPPAKLIYFAVHDTGPGIAPADQVRLFQPFIQLDSQLSRQYEGTGLGLTLVKRLTEQHGGTVQLDSAGIPGQGSCFTITLPYAFAAQQLPTDEAQDQPVITSVAAVPDSGPLLLLVEDNEVNIEVVEDYLKQAGYRIVVARTGVEALDLANAIIPALIVMDVQLPLLDGLEVTRRLRQQVRFAATPIIAVTASAMTGDRERCLAAGATAYLSKPLRLKDLLQLVRRFTESQQP